MGNRGILAAGARRQNTWKSSGAPNGIRIRAAGLKGRCPRPLDDGGTSVPPGIIPATRTGRPPGGRPPRSLARSGPGGLGSARAATPRSGPPCRAPRPAASRRRRPAPSPRRRAASRRSFVRSASSFSPALRLVAALVARPRLAHQPRAFGRAILLLAALSHQVQSHEVARAGKVAMLLPLGFDAAKGRRRFFADHPAFARKLILTNRIRWANLPQKKAGPSANHFWGIWDWRHVGPPTLHWLTDEKKPR